MKKNKLSNKLILINIIDIKFLKNIISIIFLKYIYIIEFHTIDMFDISIII